MSTPATPPKAPDIKPECAALLGKLGELGGEMFTAQEWGIFVKTGSSPTADPLEESIVQAMEKARKEAEAGNTPEAQSALLRAKALFCQAQDYHWWYRFNNQYGLLPILFTLLSAILAFDLICGWMTAFPGHAAPAHAAFLGLVGAALRALYWLQFQLGKGQLRPRLMAVFIVAPFIGAILGAISYLIVLVGFKIADSSNTAKPDTIAIGLIAAFAGYNWEWALEKFAVAAESVIGKFNGSRAGASPKTTK